MVDEIVLDGVGAGAAPETAGRRAAASGGRRHAAGTGGGPLRSAVAPTAPAAEDDLDALVARVRARIEAGEPMPAERPLAEILGVKRHQLRRALDVLRASGAYAPSRRRTAATALRPRPSRSGAATVTAPRAVADATSPIEVVEMRLAIEPMLARMAAMRATPAEIEAMQAELAAGIAAGQPRTADIALHRAICGAAHNTLATALLSFIASLDDDHRLRWTLRPETLAREREEHVAIVRAIAERDPLAAERAMTDHLRSVETWLHRRHDG